MINDKISENSWRNIHINRDKKFEILVDDLVRNSETSIFEYIKDLMVFGAMLGYNFNIKKPLPTKSEEVIQITLQTYHNSEDDGYIYLLGMIENKHATCLKNENLNETVKIFEEYCNGGLDLLQDWVDSQRDKTIIEILIEKISENTQYMETDNPNVSNEGLDIIF